MPQRPCFFRNFTFEHPPHPRRAACLSPFRQSTFTEASATRDFRNAGITAFSCVRPITSRATRLQAVSSAMFPTQLASSTSKPNSRLSDPPEPPQASQISLPDLIVSLQKDPEVAIIGDELEAILSIYGDDHIKLLSEIEKAEEAGMVKRLRYEVVLPLWEEGETLEGLDVAVMPEEAPPLRVLVNLPPMYPDSRSPQLQIVGKYLGDFTMDSGLFGDVARTYISSDGAPFTSGNVCVFEGLCHVQSLAKTWYARHIASDTAREKQRSQYIPNQHDKSVSSDTDDSDLEDYSHPPPARAYISYKNKSSDDPPTKAMRQVEAGQSHGLETWVSEEVVDRKSVFVGRAVKVTDEREVPLVVGELLQDKRIARSAHPAIFAYRIAKEVGGTAGKVYFTDCDDDGEAQAGARLSHLLEMSELENVLVVVTRWWGGHRLGPDRFKHISRVARDALEIGGFFEARKNEPKGKKGKK